MASTMSFKSPSTYYLLSASSRSLCHASTVQVANSTGPRADVLFQPPTRCTTRPAVRSSSSLPPAIAHASYVFTRSTTAVFFIRLYQSQQSRQFADAAGGGQVGDPPGESAWTSWRRGVVALGGIDRSARSFEASQITPLSAGYFSHDIEEKNETVP